MLKIKRKNIAIIAHVDHGKTTLVDQMLKQCGIFRDNQNIVERVMDSNDIEKERGITILAKCASVNYQDIKINIVDTPGHADFGGEVERILSMVDSVILLVDAAEGPMPQTKFVLSKALALGFRPIILINKIDRSDSRADEVLDEIFDLFISLEATDKQLDFPVLYSAGRDGWAVKDLEDKKENLTPLFELVISHVPDPVIIDKPEFSMLLTTLENDSFLGRMLTGKIYSGELKVNQSVKILNLEGKVVEQGRISKLFVFNGLDRVVVDSASAGDIVVIAGLKTATVSDTVCDINCDIPIKSDPIDPPTMSVNITVNNSPLAGQEGTKVTSTMIKERLNQEAEGNVAISVTETANKDSFTLGVRGELQLGVLLENMRREGFEMNVSGPKIIFKNDKNGNLLEPIEEVTIDVDTEYSGIIVEKLSFRKADLIEMKEAVGGKARLKFLAPSRSLIGYHGEFLTDTKGTGILNRIFHDYVPYKGDFQKKRNGVLISNSDGNAAAYAIFNLEDRGEFFIEHNTKVYQGMIVGLHNRDNDLEVNVTKGKQLTNMRASGKDEAIKPTTPKILTLEEASSFIHSDELLEITPINIRLRKKYLDPNERKRNLRGAKG